MPARTWLHRRIGSRVPVAVKLGVPVVAISIIAVALLGAVGVKETKARIDESYAFQARGLTQLVEAQYQRHPDDIRSMNAFLQRLVEDHPALLGAQLYRKGAGSAAYIWSSSRPDEVTDPISASALVPAGTFVQEERDFHGTPAFLHVGPVDFPNGVASVGFSFDGTERLATIGRETKTVVLDAAAVIGAEILALLVTLYLVVLIRLRRLGNAAGAVAAGDLSIRLPEGDNPPGRDELTNVAREFDRMVVSVDARARQQAAISELGRHALAASDLAELFTDAAYVVVECLGTEFSEIYELSDDKTELILRAGAGWPSQSAGSVRVPNGAGSQAGYTLEAGGPVIADDLTSETRFKTSELLREQRVTSGVSVVIRGRDRKFGVLAAHSATPQTFTRQDINLLQSIANILAAAVERTGAFDRERADAERLRELDELKNTLLRAVSHDLRNPLTSILGSASTLEHADELNITQEDREGLLRGLTSSARKMHRIVTDLLDLERLDQGILEPDRATIDLAGLVTAVVDELRVSGDREIAIDTEPMSMAVDAPMVERILENLVTNAFKYTPAGARVWVRLRRRPEGAEIIVEDDGPGVPKELWTSIFEPFRQGEVTVDSSSRTARTSRPGVGIGLSLVAKFAELHGGRAWVTDRDAGGASFHVVLVGELETPARASTEAEAESAAVRIATERGGRSSIG